jgi:Mg/Co/Ni transporter MgtE
MPSAMIRQIQQRIKANAIPWEFCNIVEPDPRRRLKLRISHHRLGKLHPADLADIVEELGPAEREALFETLDNQVAAEALSEIKPRIQLSILKSLDKQRVADIVEEMAPDSAADVLNELEEEESQEILKDMEQAPAAEVEELLEYEPDSAGGMMNTQYIALHEDANVRDAIEALRGNEDLLKNLTHIFLMDKKEKLVAAVPAARLFTAGDDTSLRKLAFQETPSAHIEDDRARVVELFDKYNLFALPVVDDEDVLRGIITADDVISVLNRES